VFGFFGLTGNPGVLTGLDYSFVWRWRVLSVEDFNLIWLLILPPQVFLKKLGQIGFKTVRYTALLF
jgi:hypothetical protein